MKKAFTVKQIADNLKLSTVTVSSVLNGKAAERGISERTAKRINDYIEKIGFHQNISALSMRGKYSKALAIVGINSYRYPAHGLLINALESYAYQHQVSSVLFSAHSHNQSRLGEVVQQLKLYNVGKIVVLGTSFKQEPMQLVFFLQNLKHYLPSARCFVYGYDASQAGKDMPFVSSAFGNVDMRYQCLNDIALKNGYEKIVMVGMASFETSRFNGVEIECIGEGMNLIGYKHQYMMRDRFFIDHGSMLAEKLRKRNFSLKKTLIYIQDDFIGMGFVRRMRKYKYRIPGDFGVITWDNMPATACAEISSFGHDYDEVAGDIVDWINCDEPVSQHTELGIVLNDAKSF